MHAPELSTPHIMCVAMNGLCSKNLCTALCAKLCITGKISFRWAFPCCLHLQASLGLNCPDESVDDLRRVLQIEPSNKSARQRLLQAEEKQKALRNKERNLYSNIFARMAEDPSSDAAEPKQPNLFDEAQNKLDAEKAAQIAKLEQAEQAATAASAKSETD